MPVKMRWILFLMIAAIALSIGAIYFVQVFNLEDTHPTYSYNEKLFNEDSVAAIDITIADEDWSDILANPLDEEYKEASITINGEKISNVAIRTKGNSSLTSVASSDSNRYSLKVDFNYYNSTQSYYGLTKLNLNNNMSDSTQMKEFVSYELMEQMGIATPAHSYMKVTVNGENYGLMLGVEAIDETFIAQNYNTAKGYLYKPDGTGSDLVYISDSLEDYTGIEVQMNEDSTDDSELISMIKTINQGEGYEEYLNMVQMLRYFAMNTALVSLDSYQGQMKHNYYLYEDEDGVFSILPWDYNMSFGGFGMGMGAPMSFNANTSDGSENESSSKQFPDSNAPQISSSPPIEEEMQQDNGQSVEEDQMPMPQRSGQGDGLMMMGSGELLSDDAINFSIYEPVSGASLTDRPLLNVLLSDETLLEQYETYLEQIAKDILTEENVTSITTKLGELLKPYIEEDPSKFSTTEEFLEGVSGDNSLPEFAKQRSESILAQLSGKLVVESPQTSSMMPGMGGDQADQQNANGELSQNGNPPQINEGMRGNFDINSMTDEEFEQFLERIQGGNFPITLPDNFDSMTTQEKKSYLTEQMGNIDLRGSRGEDGGRDRPMMNNEASDSEASTGEFTKMDVYQLLVYLALALVAIFFIRRIGK
ncbi:CotH kinase family protein [Lysinibacillus sp. SGAir0095]|uniref:CotH kinase family protein n=1 Tax=Lysinibacillus sp. SGAir0095 TaxID=2070463 RepID=UPI001F0DD1C4|nr:CotH kinase family protein [Lysinibacillus sp. SGAir0095]